MHRLIVGCGYVGRRVAEVWSRRGDRITVLTRSADHAATFRERGWEPRIGDVTQADSVADLPAADTVLIAVGLDRRSGRSQREVYVDGLRNVLCSPAGQSRRVLYISSTSVYGQDAGEWIDETSPCQPASDNGCVCLEAEQLLRSEVPAAMVLRLAGIYGPGRLVARVESLRAGEPLPRNPNAWLNLIHVDDAVAAILACDERAPAGSTWLVADDRPNTRRQFYSQVAALVMATSPVFLEQSLTPDADRSLNKRCSNRRLREVLGVTLKYPTTDTGLPASLGEPGDIAAHP
jgi:nucleoside-diphosphate-sugar epimerase